jgi:serine/threonine protein kinase
MAPPLKKRRVKDQAAQKGICFQLGSLGQVHIGLGETKRVGPYTLRLVPSETAPNQNDDSCTTGDPTETGDLDQLQYSINETDPSVPRSDVFPDIEGYRIIKHLGQGGMGTVWRAEQLSTKREVALKTMTARFDQSNKARMRFEREVELTASLDHPNIARLYDSGLHQGLYYYAMELIDGITLDRFVVQHTLSHTQIVTLAGKICQAVQFAHQRGMIHRDLKPSNIMVSPDSEPQIVDFGLARVFWGTEKDMTLSIEGEIAGTPAYMSPEQAAGHHDTMDTRSDVFSLGVILFGLLTGKSPHDLSGTTADVLQRIRQGQVRRPQTVKTSIDKDLEAILLKALALDTDDRYLSAGAMADDLANYLNGEPVNAQLPTILYFLRKKTRKYRTAIRAAAFGMLVVLGTGLFGYTKWIEYRTRVQEIEIDALQGAFSEQKLKFAELEIIILGNDKTQARLALRDMRDRHIALNEQNETLKEKSWHPLREVRHTWASTSPPLSPKSLVKRPVRLSQDLKSWTIETDTHRGPIRVVSGDRQGHYIASYGTDLVKPLDITNVSELAWINSSDTIAMGDVYGSLYCRKNSTGQIVQRWISAWCGPAYSAEFSPRGDRLAVFSGNGMVSLWETQTWEALGGWQIEDIDIKDRSGQWVLVWSSSGHELAVGTTDGTLLGVFDSYSFRQMRLNQTMKDKLNIAAMQTQKRPPSVRSQDASMLGTWDRSGHIEIRRQHETNPHHILTLTNTEILSAAWSPENRYFLATTADGTVRVWDALHAFRDHAVLMPTWGASGAGIAFTPGGDFRATSEMAESLRYLAQTEHGQKTWRAGEFRNEHGWINEPWQVGLFEPDNEETKRIYVKADADGSSRSGNGKSWDTAFVDLQDALSQASEGTEIWVAAGTYKPDRGSGSRKACFRINGGILVYGGFAGNETSIDKRNQGDNVTILSGDLNGNDQEISNNEENSYHVVVVEDANPQVRPMLLDGCVITGGNADEQRPNTEGLWLGHWGGGALIQSRHLTIQNCVFRHNSAMTNGGGLGLWDGTITINNCQFIGNYSEHSGGGASLSGESSVLKHCLFEKNIADHCGGGIYEGSNGSLIEECDFLENRASEGGAANCYMKKSFVNCCFYRNQANGSGGGLGGGVLTGSALKMRNCLFISNTTNGAGGAIFGGQQTISVENTGFVNNSARTTGGAMDALNGDVKIANSSFVENSVELTVEKKTSVGGINHHIEIKTYDGQPDPNTNAVLHVTDSILWKNSNHRGLTGEETQVKAININPINCCIQGWTGPNGQGNMGDDPQFIDLSGPDHILGTLDDDLRLKAGSPCVGRGIRFDVMSSLLDRARSWPKH